MDVERREARDAMARRVAERLAPEVGAKLPAYVERWIELGDDAAEEVPAQRIDGVSLLALGALLLQAIVIVQTEVHRREDERRRRQEDERRREDDERRLRLAESAVALARDALARELRAKVEDGVEFPEQVPAKVRVALVESVVEEGVQEAARLQGQR